MPPTTVTCADRPRRGPRARGAWRRPWRPRPEPPVSPEPAPASGRNGVPGPGAAGGRRRARRDADAAATSGAARPLRPSARRCGRRPRTSSDWNAEQLGVLSSWCAAGEILDRLSSEGLADLRAGVGRERGRGPAHQVRVRAGQGGRGAATRVRSAVAALRRWLRAEPTRGRLRREPARRECLGGTLFIGGLTAAVFTVALLAEVVS